MKASDLARLIEDGESLTQTALVIARTHRLPVMSAARADALAEVTGMSKVAAVAALIDAGFDAVLASMTDTKARASLKKAEATICAELAARAEGTESC